MAKSRLAWNNLLTVAGVVISSSSEATGYVDDNLANPARWKKWRSTTTTGDQWVKFDLGSNQNFQALIVMNAKLHTGGSLRAQANATDAWGAPTINDVLTLASPDFTKVVADWLSAVQNLRWIRFYFTNTGAVNEYVEISAVFAGTYFEPTKAIAAGSPELTPTDPSPQRRAIGGQRSAVTRPQYHVVAGLFWIVSAADQTTFRQVFAAVGASVPFVLAFDPDDASSVFYGVFDAVMSIKHYARAIYQLPFKFLEDVA
jgi:hypothetical protein